MPQFRRWTRTRITSGWRASMAVVTVGWSRLFGQMQERCGFELSAILRMSFMGRNGQRLLLPIFQLVYPIIARIWVGLQKKRCAHDFGRRRSSVFRIPSRTAVYAGIDRIKVRNVDRRYKRACAIARRTSADGKAFAKQGFYLFPKMVELDKLMRRQRELAQKVFETHPELAFWRLNGERPARFPKKQKQGICLRRKLLIDAGIPRSIAMAGPPKGAKVDDMLDALVCAVIARRIYKGRANSFPNPPPHDKFGLPMAIWA